MSSLNPDNAASTTATKSFQQRASAARSATKLAKTVKSTRTPHATASASAGANSGSAAKIATKSKYTENKPVTPAPPSRTRSHLQQSTLSATNRSAPEKKPPSSSMPTTKPKLWNRKEVTPNKSTGKVSETLEAVCNIDQSIQTNEPEILNHDLLIGDIKFLLPSKSVVNEIERVRQENKKRALLKAQRKFEEHAERQEEHLTDLKEFLEKAVVTKRSRKPKETMDIDRKLMCSMDDILNKEVRRTESITDIKGRIKKKEKELMTLFETVENIEILSITT